MSGWHYLTLKSDPESHSFYSISKVVLLRSELRTKLCVSVCVLCRDNTGCHLVGNVLVGRVKELYKQDLDGATFFGMRYLE